MFQRAADRLTLPQDFCKQKIHHRWEELVHRDPLQKIRVLSAARMKELRKVLSEV